MTITTKPVSRLRLRCIDLDHGQQLVDLAASAVEKLIDWNAQSGDEIQTDYTVSEVIDEILENMEVDIDVTEEELAAWLEKANFVTDYSVEYLEYERVYRDVTVELAEVNCRGLVWRSEKCEKALQISAAVKLLQENGYVVGKSLAQEVK